MGQNPAFPGLAEVAPASSNLESSSKAMKALKKIDNTRVKYTEFDCSAKLKIARSQRINSFVEMNYQMGDPVLFCDAKRKEWKHGLGRTLYLRFGNWLRRVPIDIVLPDYVGPEKIEESYVEPSKEVEDNQRFKVEETPVEEPA